MRFSRLIPVLLLAPSVLSGQAPAGRLPTDPNVTIGRLSNGLTYYIRVNGKPEDRAELRLVVDAGSVLEDPQQLGLAHVVEHMAFNGTAHFEKQQLVRYLESIGMRFGADLNAYTSFDETVYMLTVPTDTGRFLEQGMQILEDWAHGLTFDPREIDKERGVVIEEWRLGQGAEERMRDKYFPVLFARSRYAERLPIGTRASLEGFKHDDLMRFYRQWYRPELMAVVAVGDFDKQRVAELIKAHFSKLKATSATPRTVFPVPDHDSTLVAVAVDKEATSASVSVYHKLPVDVDSTVADYRDMLAQQLFNRMLNARLRELAQQADPPFIGASGGQGRLIRSKEAFVISAGTRDDGILRGLDAILTEALRVQRHGFTSTELEREKQNVLRGYEQAFAERDKTESSDYTAEYVDAFLEAEPIPGIAHEFELAKQLLPQITVESVNAYAAQWLTETNRVVVVQAPDKPTVKVPDSRALLDVFAQVKAKTVTPYDDRVAAASLVPSPPAPGRVIAAKADSATGITEWKLSNGVRILLKPTDFQADEVLLRAYSPGGTSLVEDKDYVSASMATFLVGLSGVGAFSVIELGKALAGKAVRVSPFIDQRTEGFSAQGSPKDLETLFQLVYLHATAPRRDSTAFQSLKARLGAALANRSASPEAAFEDTLEVTLAQHHFRARPFTADRVAEIDMERALSIYRDRFADASDFTFVIVGNFAPDSIKPLVEQYLAGLPATQRNERWRDVGIRPPKGVIEKTVKRGVEDKGETQIVFTGPVEYTLENRLALSVLLDILEIRLRDVLREDLGSTYGVGVRYSVVRDPVPAYTVTISFGAAPARLDSLTAVVFAQIDTLQKQGVKPDELAKVKETQRREWETNVKRNGYWLGQIVGRDIAGEPVSDLLSFPARLERVSAQQVRAIAALLRRDNYVRVSLIPQSH